MKITADYQSQLFRLSQIDTEVLREQHKIRKFAEQKKALETDPRLHELKREISITQSEFEQLEQQLRQLEDDALMVQSRKERDEHRLNESTISKEAQALQDEIEHLQARGDMLEQKQIDLMFEIEKAQEKVKLARGNFDIFARKCAQELKKIVDEGRARQQQVRESLAERSAVTALLPEELVKLYEKIFREKGVGAARLIDGVSEASNMALSPAELQEVNDTPLDKLIFCPHTGAILLRLTP